MTTTAQHFLNVSTRLKRDHGLTVVLVPGWQTRNHGALSTISGIVCHHTAGPTAAHNHSDYPSLTVVKSGRPGLPGPLAQFGLGRSGTVYVIASGLCWHAGKVNDGRWSNSHAIGIEAENAGTSADPWPDVQMRAYAILCAELAKEYGLGASSVRGHKEICAPAGRKTDPDFSMVAFRASVANVIAAGAKVVPKPKAPTSTAIARPSGPAPVLKTGSRGAWVKYLQSRIGATADGDFGPRTKARVAAYQRLHKLTADGIVRPKMWLVLGVK